MRYGFTLIELIVVIIIVGILAAIGINQYGKVVESGRRAESRIVMGDIRKLAMGYRLENGAIDSITNADINVGTSSIQAPSSCRDTYYFTYGFDYAVDPWMHITSVRCSSGGKTPNYSSAYCNWIELNADTGEAIWHNGGGCGPSGP